MAKTAFEQAVEQTKKRNNDKLVMRHNKLRKDIEQAIGVLFDQHGSNNVELKGDDQFELEGRDDVVTAIILEGDGSINVVTKFDVDEEIANDIMELSTNDMMNVYEFLRDLK